MSNIKCRMSNITNLMSNFPCKMSKKSKTNIKYNMTMSNIGRGISNIALEKKSEKEVPL